jgi:ubiquinone/menaquinone biosynthesis C-methylase UbiE
MTSNDKQIGEVTRSKAEARAAYNCMTRFLDVASGSFEEPERRKALALLAVQAGEQVLEIGFGSGHAVLPLAQAVGDTGKVYGIDLSDKLVAFAQRRLEDAGLAGRVDLRQGDGADLPYADARMDAALLGFTLELFSTDDIPVVLGEIRRVLRPGGRLVVVAMSKPPCADWRVRLYEWFHEKYPHYVDCRPIRVREALESAGYCVTDFAEKPMWGLPVAIVMAKIK